MAAHWQSIMFPGRDTLKITRINCYAIDIPFRPLGSRWVGRNVPTHLFSTVVEIETDSDVVGYGETCPIGAIYLPAFVGGIREAISVIAPALIGLDPGETDAVYRRMESVLFGFHSAKAAIDIACWDAFGKSLGLPVHAVLGGRFQQEVPVYASIPLDDPDTMVRTFRTKREEGFRNFQIKVGATPAQDVLRIRALVSEARAGDTLMADANRGWNQADALRVVKELDDVDCYIEQPCATYAESLTVRRKCRLPFILDEVIDSAADLARAIGDDALDALVIKVTHAGGLTPARLLRDLCAEHGLMARIEDTAGSEITRAAQAHLAAASPLQMQLGSYTFINDMDPIADGAPQLSGGNLVVSDAPGLGVSPIREALGEPIASYGNAGR